MATGKSNNFLGAIFLILSVFMFTIESAVARSLVNKVPLVYLLATRALAQLLVPMPWIIVLGFEKVWRTPGRKLHFARGGLTIFGWITFYFSAAHLPLAMSILVSFSSILWVVILAAPILGEKVTAPRWIATGVGFVGILLATQPSLDVAMLPIASALLSALISSFIVLLMRQLATTEHALSIMFYIGMCTTCVFVPAALLQPGHLDWQYLTQLLILVPVGPLGMWFMIQAYRYGEASAIMPVQYVRYLQAIAMGWLLFGEVPDRWSLIGGAIAVGAALWLTWPRRKMPLG